MKEIISLHIGSCGSNIGTKFFEVIANEHGVSSSGGFEGISDAYLEQLGVYFTESEGSQYSPRAIIVDTETTTRETVLSSPIGSLYNPDNFILGSSTGRIWAKGYKSQGSQVIDSIMETIRRRAEECESLQGFQLSHSLGGGTGSGLGCLIMQKLKEQYPDHILSTYPIFPSEKEYESGLDAYNSALSMDTLVDQANLCIMLENEAVCRLCQISYEKNEPLHSDFNNLISQAMNGITSTLRYPSQLNSTLPKIASNIVAFQRMHFLLTSFAPLTPSSQSKSVAELTKQVFDPKNSMSNAHVGDNGYDLVRYFATTVDFRGRFISTQIDEEIAKIRETTSINFAEWIPDILKTSVNEIPMNGFDSSATLLSSTDAVKETFKVLCEHFGRFFVDRKYLHLYTEEGMDEMEFVEAESHLNDLFSEYTPCMHGYDDYDEEVYDGQ